MAVSKAAERVRRHRQRKAYRRIDVSDDTLARLKAYQERWELPTLSVAIRHAVTYSKPE